MSMDKLEKAIKNLSKVSISFRSDREIVEKVEVEFVAFKKAEVLKIEKIKRMKEGEHGFDFTPSYLTLHKTVDAILEILDKPPMEACVIVPRNIIPMDEIDAILEGKILLIKKEKYDKQIHVPRKKLEEFDVFEWLKENHRDKEQFAVLGANLIETLQLFIKKELLGEKTK